MFAQVSTEQIAQGFGWPAAIVMVGLIAAILYLVRQNDMRLRKIDELQEARIQEAKDVNDKITAPMQAQIDLNRKTHDLLVELSLNLNKKRRS